jgi:hypothetical protein
MPRGGEPAKEAGAINRYWEEALRPPNEYVTKQELLLG